MITLAAALPAPSAAEEADHPLALRAIAALPASAPLAQALSHHLVGCGQLEGLQRLLMDPGWLEAKLHAYGTGAVVADFR